jgi:nitronate monooxygenase
MTVPTTAPETGPKARVAAIKAGLRLPAFAAPMFLVSGPELVIAACKAGLIGAFPTINARPPEVLEAWLAQIATSLAEAEAAAPGTVAPWAANLIVHRTATRFAEDFERVLRYRPQIVITALGSPARVVDAVHAYGGLVFADVNSVAYARKAVDAGADGLVLIAAGAGGHTGHVTGFALVPAIRSFFDGPLVLGGGIVTGGGIRAAEVLGADFAYLGTRFIAAQESLAPAAYRELLVAATEEDIVLSAHFTGIPANYVKQSIRAAGLDPDALTIGVKDFSSRHEGRAWRDIWSAGHGVRRVDGIAPVADIVATLKREYDAARATP